MNVRDHSMGFVACGVRLDLEPGAYLRPLTFVAINAVRVLIIRTLIWDLLVIDVAVHILISTNLVRDVATVVGEIGVGSINFVLFRPTHTNCVRCLLDQ